MDDDFANKAKNHFKNIRTKFCDFVSATDQTRTKDYPDFIPAADVLK